MNDTEPTDAGRVDLFVSHAGRDRAWAEWVAWELQQAGYRVELDFWDWEVGENFVVLMVALGSPPPPASMPQGPRPTHCPRTCAGTCSRGDGWPLLMMPQPSRC